MYKSPQSIIREVIEFDCTICYQVYDEQEKYPMIICPRQHTCCLACLDNLLFCGKQQNEAINCPLCKAEIYRKDAQKFRMLNEIRITAKKLRVQGSTIRNNVKQLTEEKGSLQVQLQKEKEKNQWLIQQMEQLKKQMNSLIKQNEFLKDEKEKEKQKNQCPLVEDKSKQPENAIRQIKCENKLIKRAQYTYRKPQITIKRSQEQKLPLSPSIKQSEELQQKVRRKQQEHQNSNFLSMFDKQQNLIPNLRKLDEVLRKKEMHFTVECTIKTGTIKR